MSCQAEFEKIANKMDLLLSNFIKTAALFIAIVMKGCFVSNVADIWL